MTSFSFIKIRKCVFRIETCSSWLALNVGCLKFIKFIPVENNPGSFINVYPRLKRDGNSEDIMSDSVFFVVETIYGFTFKKGIHDRLFSRFQKIEILLLGVRFRSPLLFTLLTVTHQSINEIEARQLSRRRSLCLTWTKKDDLIIAFELNQVNAGLPSSKCGCHRHL